MSPEGANPAFDVEEYRALRSTIRERGTARLIVIVVTILTWAALTILIAAQSASMLLTLATLLALVAGFEVVFALHVGVERVGRYIQVRYEEGAGRAARWEQMAMELGRIPGPPSRIDPLASYLFAAAILLNVLPVTIDLSFVSGASGPIQSTLWLVCVAHAAALLRVFRARRFAGRQRARDLAFFRDMMPAAESKELVR